MNEIEKFLEEIKKIKEVEKIPAIIKRCPKCHNLTLNFDPKTRRIYCNSCNFEIYLPELS